MNEIANLQPSCIWRNFDALTKVPRPSGHLEKVQQFLLDFAKRVGVEAFIDEGNNIVMKKPATPGMERRKVVLMQAHMDMVPQKSPESNHNFETDPIETYIDGEGWVRAKGTTLGADNGLGVAAIMAVMEATDLQHGPVEGLITADEETGMFGANDLPKGELNGDIMLNLDSEMWGKFVIGSAGGVDVDTTLDYKEVETDPEDAALKVTLKGLRGGHSGLEIHEGRANANKLMVRFVREAIETCEARLVSWNGGNMRNAIPFKAEVVLTMPKENVEAVKALVDDWKADFEDEYKYIEENIEFFAEKVETPKTEVPVEIQDNLIDAIYACHNGVVRMIPAYPDVVETSSNLAIIKIENGKAAFKILVRSSREDMKDYAVKTLEMLKRIYKEQNGKEAIVQVDHAGLECSVILEKYPNMDVVSLGPTLLSPHTTNERCQISTVEPFWKLLKQVLIEVPEK